MTSTPPTKIFHGFDAPKLESVLLQGKGGIGLWNTTQLKEVFAGEIEIDVTLKDRPETSIDDKNWLLWL
jgi:hypothetical protein